MGCNGAFPQASAAHPLDDRPAILLQQSITATAKQLGVDEKRWLRAVGPLARRSDALLQDALGPVSIPRHPLLMALFGTKALWPSTTYAKLRFRTTEARALLAGCAAHSVLPLEKPLTTAVALMFALIAHTVDWPVAAGGSAAISNALAGYFRTLGWRNPHPFHRAIAGRFFHRLESICSTLIPGSWNPSPVTGCRPDTVKS